MALPVKDVVIHGIELMGLEQAESTADVVIQVKCGAGTYVRALADDLGEVLGVGGHLHMLRRTSTGSLSVDDALPLDVLRMKAPRHWRLLPRPLPLPSPPSPLPLPLPLPTPSLVLARS